MKKVLVAIAIIFVLALLTVGVENVCHYEAVYENPAVNSALQETGSTFHLEEVCELELVWAWEK